MKNKKYIMYLVVSILVLTIGVSYAYFKARVNGEGKSISLRSKGIYVLYSGDATLASESISPGWSVTKEFTVENQGSNNEVYNIYIEGLVNTFVTSGYLQYKITSSNGYNMSEYKDIPKSNTSTDTVLAYSVPIKSKEKQTYKVELIYKETEEDQSVDMGKILSGILGIQVGTKDPNLFTASVVVINGSSDTNSKEVYKGNDVTFTITPNDGYTLEDASISCSNGTLSNNLLTISNVQSDVNCTITLNSALPTLAQAMLRDNTTIKERTDFSVTNTETTTGTLYKTNKTEDGSDVYYYSGNTTNNWVKFGKYTSSDTTNSLWNNEDDMYWRIIRTNEDGSARMIYSGTSPDTTTGYIGSTEFNDNSRNPMYVGYMYGTSGSLANNRKNIKDSTIKTYIDAWYQNHLLNDYDKYISKSAIYCNDRSVGSGTYCIGSDTSGCDSFNYGGLTRLNTNKTPSYKCGTNITDGLFEDTQAVEDKFSINTTSNGNGKLTYPIALMTADEVSFAGGKVFERDKDNTLSGPYAWYYINSVGKAIVKTHNWWLLTPSSWDSNSMYAHVLYVSTAYDSGIESGYPNDTYRVRPVISISKCAKVKSGIGTPASPYEIDENSCK